MTINFYLEQPYAESKDLQERKSIQETIKTLKREKRPIPVGLLNPNETSVYLFVRDGKQKTIKVKTGIRILPKYWTGDKENPVKKNLTGSPELNQYFRDLKSDAYKIINDKSKAKGGLSFEQVEQEIQKLVLKLPDIDHQITLVTLFNWFIDGDSELDIHGNPNGLSESTLKKYRKSRELVQAFAIKHKQSLDLNNINYAWWAKFKNYLLSTGNYLNQSANKHLEKIKALLNYAILSYSKEKGGHIEEETCQRLAVNLMRFDLLEFSEKNRVHPEEEEMEFLRALNLSLEPRLERVVDIMVFTAWTGPRCSNLKELLPFQVDLEGNTLRYKAVKTKDQADTEVPLNDIAVNIIRKYWGKQDTLLPMIAGQNLNPYFQEVLEVCAKFHEIGASGADFEECLGKLQKWPDYHRFCTWIKGESNILSQEGLEKILKQTAGFNKTVEIKERRGGIMETYYHKRYKLLTLHTMRHYYGTYLVNEGLGLEDVAALMAITPETAKTYAKTKNQKAAAKARAILQKPQMKIA